MKRLVYGFGAGLVYGLGGNGEWKQNLPKVLDHIPPETAILISAVDMPLSMAKILVDLIGSDRMFVDSGGFGLYKKQFSLGSDNPEFHKQCEKMKKKFFKLLETTRPVQCFELDNDYFKKNDDLLSPENFCRQEVFDILGYYPTPVFKLHQGIEYWKALCESPLYPKLSIGGLAQTRSWHTRTADLKLMMDYARECGKDVHLLGCQNVEAFKMIQPTTVDYSIFQFAISLAQARKEHPELLEYSDIKKHLSLYSITRANQRSFLYESFKRD